jgi:thiol-disulfide isomerase/thioredoxin
MSNKPNLRTAAPKRPGAEERRPWWMSPITWVVGILVVAFVVTIALTVGGDDGSGGSGTSSETAFAEILGPPLPLFDGAGNAVGTEAPRIVAQTMDGDRVEVGGDGTARLYGFFTHWCSHCQAELPRVTAWLGENDLPDGVEVMAVSTSVDPTRDNYPPSAWFEREGWPNTVLIDDVESPLARGFGLSAFPFWVAVDADGNVVARTEGELDIEQFEALVDLVNPASATS